MHMKKRVVGIMFGFVFLSLVIALVIDGTTSYNSIDTNITQETGFAHLNISNANLIAYYPFDVNTSTYTYDYTNSSNEGTLNNGIAWNVSGYLGGAYKFDGTDDYISITNINFATTDNWTLSSWVYQTGTKEFEFTFGSSGVSNTENFNFDNIAGIIHYRNSTNSYHTWNVGEDYKNAWHYFTFVCYGNGTMELFYDGVSQGTNPVGLTSPTFNAIGRAYENNNFNFEGRLDEVMIFNRTLSATEVTQIYNSTFSRFYPYGEMLFQSNNFGATNTSLNISLANCGTLNSSYLQAKINSGSYSNFSSCSISNYNVTGDTTSANLTIKFLSNPTKFYSPTIIGNITLTSWDSVAPNVNISAPTSGQTFTSSSVSINVITNDNSTCEYSTNSGATNSSLTANSTGTGHTVTATLSNAAYVLRVYCSDLYGNANNSQNVLFTVAVPSTATEEEEGGSGGIYLVSSSQLQKGYSKVMKTNQKINLRINNKSLDVKLGFVNLENKSVEFSLENKTYGLIENGTQKIDTNKDEYYDLQISVSNVYMTGYAQLMFKEIYEEVPAETEEEQSENVVEEEKVSFWKKEIYYTLGGVVFIGLIVWILIDTLKLRKSDRRYKYWKGRAKRDEEKK